MSIHGLNLLFKMQFWEYLGENPEIFACGTLISCAVEEMFIEVPLFQETSPIPKNSRLHAWYDKKW